jgi:hypothetical protein
VSATGIPLTDAPRLRRFVNRTLVVEIAALAAAIALIVAFALAGRRPQAAAPISLPHGANSIIVLDLSASISSDTFSRIGNTLAQLAAGRGRDALIVFSDEAYEALPPGTPAADLRPFVRYFVLPPQKTPGFQPTFPTNPWTGTFTAGTNISAGMALAREVALTSVKRPVVTLISDLDDDPGDIPRLVAVLAAYRANDIPVRVVGLNPTPADQALFERLLGPAAPITQASLPSGASALRSSVPFPWPLLGIGLAVALLLAGHQAWGPALSWRRPA